MSIHTFSPTEFENVVKDIFKNNRFIGISNADVLTFNSSFRDVLDITSLEIAQLIIVLEKKYNVNMEWINIADIDSVNDVYKYFIQSIINMRKPKIAMPIQQNQR